LTDSYYQIHHDACIIKYMCEDSYDEQWLHKDTIDIEKIRIDFKEKKVEKYYNNNKHMFLYDFTELPSYKKLLYMYYKRSFDNLNYC